METSFSQFFFLKIFLNHSGSWEVMFPLAPCVWDAVHCADSPSEAARGPEPSDNMGVSAGAWKLSRRAVRKICGLRELTDVRGSSPAVTCWPCGWKCLLLWKLGWL